MSPHGAELSVARARSLPVLRDLEWSLLAGSHACCVGLGAVGRPLAELLASLGVGRFVLVDPRKYRPASVRSQCEPEEVGRPKVEVVAERLARLGARATPLEADVCNIEPGHVAADAVLIVSVDNRRADLGAARLAAMMARPIIKVNVEPTGLTASIRAFDMRPERVEVCPECQFTERQYRAERHPRSCDGWADETGAQDPAGRATGSPRALCHFAASAAALAYAQLVGSPGRWARRWYGRQWQQALLGGTATWSTLASNPLCRWEHGRRWEKLERLGSGPARLTLVGLIEAIGGDPRSAQLEFSGRVATRAACACCGRACRVAYWLRGTDPRAGCCGCGGALVPVPFWTYSALPAAQLRQRWEQPLAAWGVPPWAIIAIQTKTGAKASFVIGSDDAHPVRPNHAKETVP